MYKRQCKYCLDNYWNQRNHQFFDRYLGLQLLNYAQFGQLPDEYDVSEQEAFLVPLKKLISEDKDTSHPVSYTHLDVYKRQMRRAPALP